MGGRTGQPTILNALTIAGVCSEIILMSDWKIGWPELWRAHILCVKAVRSTMLYIAHRAIKLQSWSTYSFRRLNHSVYLEYPSHCSWLVIGFPAYVAIALIFILSDWRFMWRNHALLIMNRLLLSIVKLKFLLQEARCVSCALAWSITVWGL